MSFSSTISVTQHDQDSAIACVNACASRIATRHDDGWSDVNRVQAWAAYLAEAYALDGDISFGDPLAIAAVCRQVADDFAHDWQHRVTLYR